MPGGPVDVYAGPMVAYVLTDALEFTVRALKTELDFTDEGGSDDTGFDPRMASVGMGLRF